MKFTGDATLNAPVDKVWDALLDPSVLVRTIPGCERLEPLGGDRYRAKLTVTLAAVSGAFDGTVAMVDQQPPVSYRLLVDGQGRSGFVKGESTITLADRGGATAVAVDGRVQVGGAIARVGQRILSSVAAMMMDRFFGCLGGRRS